MLKEFKELVDKAQSVVSKFNNDYHAICAYLDIDTTRGYAQHWVTDKLRAMIDELLVPKDNNGIFPTEAIIELRDGLIYESVLENYDNSEYLTVLETVGSGHKALISLTSNKEWHDAIVFAKDYNLVSPNVYAVQHSHLREKYTRSYDVARASLALKYMGCDVVLNDCILEIPAGLESVAASIEDLIKELGAMPFINSLFEFMVQQGHYIEPLKRYVIVNPISIIPSHARQLLPFGFLLNLAIKHLGVRPGTLTAAEQQSKFKAALEHARLIATVADIRNYGVFDTVFQPTEELPSFISRLALFDSTYTINSNDPDEMLAYLTHLFDWLDEHAFEIKLGFSVPQFKAVAKTILDNAPKNGPVFFTLKNAESWNSAIPKEVVKAILSYLSHGSDTVNKDYFYLHDYIALDFGFKPLVEIQDRGYVLADKSWCAPAFFEAFSACCREVDRECDNKIGAAAERYLTGECLRAGITMLQGDYARATGRKTGEGEADGIIESARTIITLESKKKPLTRRARGGSDVQLLVDLAGSLLAAHLQSGRTEIKFREDGHIYLLNPNGNLNRVDLNGREIERIAMSVLDFGSFQDRTVINGLLTNLANAQYKLIAETNPQDVAKFENLEIKRTEWAAQVQKLKILDPKFEHFPFFNCWFLSLSQLLMIIRYSKSNEDFASALKSTRHVTFGASNFYYEFYQFFILQQGL